MWLSRVPSAKAGHWEDHHPFMTNAFLPILVRAQRLALQFVYPAYVHHIPARWAKAGALRTVISLQFKVRECYRNCWGLSQKAGLLVGS